ncbi:MAG: hypothetical protein GXO86_10055 [Chlorobi bacterium]|nr:hypothetical protein [Chlorobiota bacterium]
MTFKNPIKHLVSWLTISFFVLWGPHAVGQEMFGVTLGNYNGLTGSLINPAVMTNSKNYLEINFIAGDIFAFNSAAYIPASDLTIWDLFKQDTQFPVYGEKKSSFLIYTNRNPKYAVQNTRFLGPSAMFQYGNHSFAITTGFRFFTSANNIPWEMPVFGYEGMDYGPINNVSFDDYHVDAVTQAWIDVGLSYAYNVYHFLDNQVTVGVTARKLWGYMGVYGQINNVNYIIPNDSVLNILNLNGEMGFAVPVDYSNNDFPLHNPVFKGSGVGFDVGVVYTKRRFIDDNRWKKPCGQEFKEYVYRIGLSILDIGRVKYSKNAQLHTFNDVSAYWVNYDTISYSSVNEVVQEISNVFYGDPNASYSGNSFKIGLPTAVSLQFDYNIERWKNVYFGLVWIQPVRLNRHSLRRPAQISLVPRYETKYLEFSLPIQLYEYRYPRVGFAARFAFLTIGTERIGTYLGLADLNGLDIYFSIKLNLTKGSCRKVIPVKCLNYEYGYSDKDKARFRKRR